MYVCMISPDFSSFSSSPTFSSSSSHSLFFFPFPPLCSFCFLPVYLCSFVFPFFPSLLPPFPHFFLHLSPSTIICCHPFFLLPLYYDTY